MYPIEKCHEECRTFPRHSQSPGSGQADPIACAVVPNEFTVCKIFPGQAFEVT